MSLYYELLDESIEPLDEGIGKTAAAAATAAALAAGATTIPTNHVKNVPDQPTDVLVVPEYKDMPNLWGDTNEVKPQKVSVAKPVEKQVSKTSVKPAAKTASKPASKPTVKKAVANSANSFKDAAGNTWSLDPAFDFLKDAENFKSRAYKDGKVNINGKKVQRYSIGYGTLAPGNNPRATITEPEARKAKIDHIMNNVLPLIKKKGMVFDNQGQFSSVVSYIYNVGHLPPMLKNGKVDWEEALNTNVFNGKKNRGLMDRRKAEMYNALIGN